MKARGIFCLLCALLLIGESTDAQQWDWVQRFSGDGMAGTAVGVDDAQNVYVASTFKGTNLFTSNTDDNVLLAKFDPSGMPLWTTAAGGGLTRMLVASNGSVFVCGSLSFKSPASDSSISNVFVARLDDGNLSWAQPSPEGVPGAANMAFGPDETIYTLSGTNQATVRRYTQGGLLLDSISIQREPFIPLAITIGPHEQIYVAGRYATNWPYVVDFTALVSSSGELIWTWTPGTSAYYYDNRIQAIAATPDGGVLSVGFHSTPLPSKGAFIVKHSMAGTQEWITGVSGYFKSFYSAEAVTVDREGNIYVTGNAAGSYYNGVRLLILTLSPRGEPLFDERIASYVRGHANNGRAIAVDKEGAVFVTGTLEGRTIFGTNKLSNGAGGFVARRSTLFPELVQERAGNNFVFSWPTTALPFALQQSTDGGSNWSFVAVGPQRSGWRNQTVLPANADTLFRLLRTNEVPVLHPPRIFPLYAPGVAFLSHTQVLITGNSSAPASRLGVYFDDEDDNPLTVMWTNLQTGEVMTNNVLISKLPGVDDWNIRHGPYYGASVALDAFMFLPGRYSNAVSVSVSDGTSTMTEIYPEFEVISSETALAEFLSALDALRHERAGRQAVLVWEAWRRAKDRGREKLVAQRWRHFERQLQRVTLLSQEERGRLLYAALHIQALLQPP